MSSSDYIKKDELCQHIESSICRWCEHYNGGEFSKPCTLCKVSQVFCQIDLSTKYNLTEAEIKPKRPKCGSCKYIRPYTDKKTGYKTHICGNEFRDMKYRYDAYGKPYFFYPSRKACKDYVPLEEDTSKDIQHHSCLGCKYENRNITDEPCMLCNNSGNKWEDANG